MYSCTPEYPLSIECAVLHVYSETLQRVSISMLQSELQSAHLGHFDHAFLKIIIHATSQPQQLPEPTDPKDHVSPQQDGSEQQVARIKAPPSTSRQLPVLAQRPTSPQARDLDPVNRAAEELIVSLDDP